MNTTATLPRRQFLQAGVASLGWLAGGSLLAGCKRQPPPAAPAKPPLGPRFTYNVGAATNTPPALLLYGEKDAIPTGLAAPKCIAVDAHDLLYVGGDQTVLVFDPNGKRLPTTYDLPDQPGALVPASNGLLWVALPNRIEAYRVTGERVVQGDALGEKACLTGIALAPDALFIADAGNREIIRCDLEGRVLGRFGRLNSGDGNPGFVVPSPYFHILYGADGKLWVNNPGRHRLEAYTPDGRFERSWGQASMQLEGFCGCCNPVYFAQGPDGRFVTSEKGLNRIKIYDAQGTFVGVVAGPEQLVRDLAQARQACADCKVGFGFDVACDSRGRVLALDPTARTVRVFAPQAPAPTPVPPAQPEPATNAPA